MKTPLQNLDRIVGSGLRWFCILSFLALMGVLSGVVFIRFWPIAKLSWSDEVIELLMAWIVFIGAAALWRENAHFRIEAILRVVEKLKFGWILGVAVETLSALFILLFTYFSYDLTIAAGDVSPILSLPRPLWYAVMPISGAIMVAYSFAYGVQMSRQTFVRGKPVAAAFKALDDGPGSCGDEKGTA